MTLRTSSGLDFVPTPTTGGSLNAWVPRCVHAVSLFVTGKRRPQPDADPGGYRRIEADGVSS